MIDTVTKIKGKPFLKWAGGKTQLLSTIDTYLPEDFRSQKDVTYIEPFAGGGAMLFFMLQKYPNIKRAIINDINSHLTKTYQIIKEQPYELISFLSELQSYYRGLGEFELQKECFLNVRRIFNTRNINDIEEAGYMIFMNRVCFNGLYRENSKGEFNVPFGRYTNPTICDEELILADSELLQNVVILTGDFTQVKSYVQGYTLIYFDPPYRPLDATSSFNSYVMEGFDDKEQKRLKNFFGEMSKTGCKEILSNSDCKGRNESDNFFDELYGEFIIERVYARRSINANAAKRGTLTELLIRNYKNCKGDESPLKYDD